MNVIMFTGISKKVNEVCAYSVNRHAPSIKTTLIDRRTLGLNDDKLKYAALVNTGVNCVTICCGRDTLFLASPLVLLEMIPRGCKLVILRETHLVLHVGPQAGLSIEQINNMSETDICSLMWTNEKHVPIIWGYREAKTLVSDDFETDHPEIWKEYTEAANV